MSIDANNSTAVNGGIPDYIVNRLNSLPPQKGQRHKALTDLSLQMVGEKIPDPTIFRWLRAWIPDKDKSDRELNDLITGAHKLNPQPAGGSRTGAPYNPLIHVYRRPPVKPIEFKPVAEPVNVPASPLSTVDFLKLAFKPGEIVCINKTAELRDGKWTISSSGTFQTLEWWCEKLSEPEIARRYDCPQGAWIRINPFKPDADDGSDHEIAAFRHLLVESDSRPIEEQWQIGQQAGFPITAVTHSGDKSLHFLVRVDAANADEYKERCAMVYEALAGLGYDEGNKNPSRFSRLPGAVRAGVKQQLIATNLGAASWQEWESRLPLDDGLPEDVDLCDLLIRDIPEPTHVFVDLLRERQVGLLSGGSKTNKSWTMAEIALTVSQGVRFMPWEANVGKVYYIDTELEAYDLQQRFRKIAKAKGLNVDPGEITTLLLRGEDATLTAVVDRVIRKLKGAGYKLICIDSQYSLLEGEENSNDYIRIATKQLHRLARETGACVLATLHHAKGDQSGKRALDRVVGAGAWGRACDFALDIMKHSEQGAFNIEVTLRTFADVPSFVARRENHIWVVDEAIKPDQGKSGKDATLFTILDYLNFQLNREAPTGEWQKLVESETGIKRDVFNRLKKKCEERGWIETHGGKGKATVKLLAKRDDSGTYKEPQLEPQWIKGERTT